MYRWLPPVERVLLAAWVGGMWTAGFVVAPLLFNMLDDRVLAGDIAGRLFTITNLVGIVVVALLLVSNVVREGRPWFRSLRPGALLVMLVVILVGQFGITPRMQEIKEAAGGAPVSGSAMHSRFALLHGISSSLFLVNSILGAVLVGFGVRKAA